MTTTAQNSETARRRRTDEAAGQAVPQTGQSADTAALQGAGTTAAQARERVTAQAQAARDAAADLYAQRNGAGTAGTQLPASRLSTQNGTQTGTVGTAQLPASRLSAQTGTQTGTAGNAVNPYASQTAAQNAQLDALAGEARRTTQAGQLSHADSSSFLPYLDTWRQNAVRQSEGRVDNAVRQGTQELTRAQAEAEEQYRTQMNQISADEARARDNQALYNAAQGNQGGIGSAQMDAVAVNAMNNRNTLTNARNKAAREIRQQVIDLRAQGEFQKADAAIEIGNQYLIALKELEQWDMQYNLTVDQFNAQMNQRLMDYLAQVQSQKIETSRWAEQMGFQYQQFQYGMNQDELNRQERYDRYDVEDARDKRNFNYQVNQDELNRQERYDRYKVEDDHWKLTFDQGVKQFQESLKLDYDKLDFTKEQFAESLRQFWAQFYASEDQRGIDNAFREKQLEQAASQFAQSLGLDREKFVESAKQWWTQFGAQQDQQTFSNNVTLRQLANNENQDAWQRGITERQLENAENQQRTTNARAARQDADSQAQAARNRLASTAQALLNAGVSIANSPDMLDALGMTAEQSELYRSAATQGLVSSGGKSSGGASGAGGTSGGASGTAQNAEALFEAAAASGMPANFIASNYKKYGFTSSSGLTTQYNAWAKDENNLMTNGPSKNTATVTGIGQDAKVTVNKGTGTPGGTVPFNYDPEEGIVTINGKSFSSGRDFTNYMQTLNLSRDQWISLYNRMGLYGTAFQSVREKLAEELGLN